jgi:undecaprenyl pyrophosphate synthase
MSARHVAIITDGNGRWAHARGLSIYAGHDAGADTLKARLRDAVELGIEQLTVYSFSTENWSRPAAEVQGLISMLAQRIEQETPELHREGVRMRFVGRLEQATAPSSPCSSLSTTADAPRFSTRPDVSTERPRRSSASACTPPTCTTLT